MGDRYKKMPDPIKISPFLVGGRRAMNSGNAWGKAPWDQVIINTSHAWQGVRSIREEMAVGIKISGCNTYVSA